MLSFLLIWNNFRECSQAGTGETTWWDANWIGLALSSATLTLSLFSECLNVGVYVCVSLSSTANLYLAPTPATSTVYRLISPFHYRTRRVRVPNTASPPLENLNFESPFRSACSFFPGPVLFILHISCWFLLWISCLKSTKSQNCVDSRHVHQ